MARASRRLLPTAATFSGTAIFQELLLLFVLATPVCFLPPTLVLKLARRLLATLVCSTCAWCACSESIGGTTSDYEREKLQERLAKLSGGIAVIKVRAPEHHLHGAFCIGVARWLRMPGC
jgi:hypothetical protein